jgi:hypothetical protein
MPQRKKTSITVDPELWHKFQIKAVSERKKTPEALDAALGVWLKSSSDVDRGNDEEQELVKVFISYLREHGPDSLPRKILFNHLGYKKIDKSNNVSHLTHNKKKLG